MSTNGMKKNLLAISDPRRRARELSRLVAEQQALLTDLAQLRRETIAELRAGGLSRAQVAEVLGVSPGRVAQLEPSSTASLTPPTSSLTGQSPPIVDETGRDTMQGDGN
jgi:DNA-binding transcriptional regulator YiaG